MTKRGRWRRKTYRWRIDRKKSFKEITANMRNKRLKRICIETLTLYPWAMTAYDNAAHASVRFELAKKDIRLCRKLGLLFDGSKRK